METSRLFSSVRGENLEIGRDSQSQTANSRRRLGSPFQRQSVIVRQKMRRGAGTAEVMALITQWDSVYGFTRAKKKTFIRSIERRTREASKS